MRAVLPKYILYIIFFRLEIIQKIVKGRLRKKKRLSFMKTISDMYLCMEIFAFHRIKKALGALLIQAISGAPNRFNDTRLCRIVFNLFADAVDMDRYRGAVSDIVIAPYLLKKLLF